MTPSQLRAFVQVCQTGSFGDAAEQLHMSQPALSIAIKKLEQNLGGNLFDRSSRQLELTPEGEAFLPMAKRLVQEWRTVKDDVSRLFSLQQGVLVIAAMPSFANSLLPALVDAFHRQYPNVRIRIHDVVMEEAISKVLTGEAEIAFTFAPDDRRGLNFEPLFTEQFSILLPDKTDLGQVTTGAFKQVLSNPMIALNRGSTLRFWVDELFANEGIDAHIVAEVNQLSTLARLVQEGSGIGIVPSICVPWLKQEGLRTFEVPKAKMAKEIGVLWRNRGTLSKAADAMLSALQDQTWTTTSS